MLSIVFTEDSFRIDHTEAALTEDEQAFRDAYPKDRYQALFRWDSILRRRGRAAAFLS